MLVQQVYSNPKFAEFLSKNFVLYRASRGDKIGDAVYDKFAINATPTELIVDGNGKEVDWIVGYGPPADKFIEKLKRSHDGIDTYTALAAAYEKNPNDVAVAFKLAQKCASRYKDELTAKSKDLYQKVVALDPSGKTGTYTFEYQKATVSYTEAAEFELAQTAAFDRTPDPAPIKAYVAKYPKSPLLKTAYGYLARYYQYFTPDEASAADAAAKEKAAKGKLEASQFFDLYAAKYPQDASILNTYVDFIIKQKGPVEKGLEIAEKVKEITGYPENPDYMQNLAQLYVLKGDESKANEEYGKDFIDSYVSTTVNALIGYANFWVEKGKNLESVEATADLAAKMASPTQSYYLQQVAGIYVKLKKMDKALAVFGPEFAKKSGGDANALLSYAAFWNRQGENLGSALDAAKKSVALAPDYYNNFTLAQILFKMKNYTEALPAAEKAVELVKPMVAKYQFPVAPYETLVKQIKDAMAKEKGAK